MRIGRFLTTVERFLATRRRCMQMKNYLKYAQLGAYKSRHLMEALVGG